MEYFYFDLNKGNKIAEVNLYQTCAGCIRNNSSFSFIWSQLAQISTLQSSLNIFCYSMCQIFKSWSNTVFHVLCIIKSNIIKPVAVDNKTMFLHQLPLLAEGGTVGFAGIVHTSQGLEQSSKVEQAVVVQPEATGCPSETSLCNKTIFHHYFISFN